MIREYYRDISQKYSKVLDQGSGLTWADNDSDLEYFIWAHYFLSQNDVKRATELKIRLFSNLNHRSTKESLNKWLENGSALAGLSIASILHNQPVQLLFDITDQARTDRFAAASEFSFSILRQL